MQEIKDKLDELYQLQSSIIASIEEHIKDGDLGLVEKRTLGKIVKLLKSAADEQYTEIENELDFLEDYNFERDRFKTGDSLISFFRPLCDPNINGMVE